MFHDFNLLNESLLQICIERDVESTQLVDDAAQAPDVGAAVVATACHGRFAVVQDFGRLVVEGADVFDHLGLGDAGNAEVTQLDSVLLAPQKNITRLNIPVNYI